MSHGRVTALTHRSPFRVSLGGNASGALLMIGGMLTLQTGSALATHFFPVVGPTGTAWLRMGWAALFLVLMTFRSLGRELRKASRRDIGAALLLGAVSAGMTMCYSEAVARIPLGTATAVEFLGPLAVAVLAMHRRKELVWIAIAALGLLFLTRPWAGEMDTTGLLFALGAAVCWALFVLATQAVGERFSGINGLAVAMVSAALVSAPFGAGNVIANPDPATLAATAGIAILMPLLPYALEMEALRRLTRSTYGTIAGLEPAVAALIGLVVLTQLPDLAQGVGILLIVTAGIGAARGNQERSDGGSTVVRSSAGPTDPPGPAELSPAAPQVSDSA
jgi:inner membrane transporter RhtA